MVEIEFIYQQDKTIIQANINDLFQSVLSTNIKCKECGNISSHDEIYIDISLPIKKGKLVLVDSMKNVLVFPCGSEIGLEIHNSLKYSKDFKLYGGSSVDDHGKFVYENYISGHPYYSSEILGLLIM